MAREYKPADLNQDGKVTAKERRQYKKQQALNDVPEVDPLEREQLEADYKAAVGIIYSVPELQGLFEQAVDEGWEPTRLLAAVQSSEWYLANNEYAREAWAAENIGGADWEAKLENARLAVRQAATAVGSDITDEELNALARRYIYEGWSDSTRQNLLAQALSEEIAYLPDSRGVLRGGAGDLTSELRSLAYANGVTYSDNWFLSAAKSVASGLSMASDWERDIREQAAGLYPVYADKIRGGVSVYDLASPYLATMADEFEIDRNNISLNDPYVRSALSGLTTEGNFEPMNLWEFTKKLRRDPRWENTAKAQNEITSTTGRVMQMFGLMGG